MWRPVVPLLAALLLLASAALAHRPTGPMKLISPELVRDHPEQMPAPQPEHESMPPLAKADVPVRDFNAEERERLQKHCKSTRDLEFCDRRCAFPAAKGCRACSVRARAQNVRRVPDEWQRGRRGGRRHQVQARSSPGSRLVRLAK